MYNLNEKSVSQSQQRLFGMVHNCQKTGKCQSPKIKKIAQSIGYKDAEDFAKTKHKGLPERKKSFKEWFEIRECGMKPCKKCLQRMKSKRI